MDGAAVPVLRRRNAAALEKSARRKGSVHSLGCLHARALGEEEHLVVRGWAMWAGKEGAARCGVGWLKVARWSF